MTHQCSRNWMFICNASGNPTANSDKKRLQDLISYTEKLKKNASNSKWVRGCVFQIEKSEVGTLHVQGFIQLEKDKSLSAIKKLLQFHDPNRFMRLTAVNDVAASIDYCSKKGSWTNSQGEKHFSKTIGQTTYIRVENIKRNNIVKKAFKTTTNSAIQIINSLDKPFYQVGTENPDCASKHQSFYDRMIFEERHRKRVAKGFIKLKVLLYHGDAGTGKTRSVYEEFGYENVFSLEIENRSIWFNGYFNQSVLLIDDFQPKIIPRHYFVKLLDGNPMRLAIKGGFAIANWHTVIVTSNWPEKDILTDEGIKRRFTNIISFSADHTFRTLNRYNPKRKALQQDKTGDLKSVSTPNFLDIF